MPGLEKNVVFLEKVFRHEMTFTMSGGALNSAQSINQSVF